MAKVYIDARELVGSKKLCLYIGIFFCYVLGVTGNKLIFIFIGSVVLITINYGSSGNKMWKKKVETGLVYF